MSTGTALEVLRERNFRFLFAARTTSFFGTNLAPIAVAFAVLGLTGSATDVGLAFAAWTLAQISTLLVGGVVGDRLPRRLVMVASDSANLCRLLLAGLVPETVPPRLLQQVSAFMSIARYAAFPVGARGRDAGRDQRRGLRAPPRRGYGS